MPWVFYIGGEMFKGSLAHSVAVIIQTKNNFISPLKASIANSFLLKFQMHMCYYVFLSDESFLT